MMDWNNHAFAPIYEEFIYTKLITDDTKENSDTKLQHVIKSLNSMLQNMDNQKYVFQLRPYNCGAFETLFEKVLQWNNYNSKILKILFEINVKETINAQCKNLTQSCTGSSFRCWNPIHCCVEHRNYEMVQYILNNGGCVNAYKLCHVERNRIPRFSDSYKKTPLHIAVRNNDYDMVKLLCINNNNNIFQCNVNLFEEYFMRDKFNIYLQTSLCIAIEFGYIDIIKLLMIRGAEYWKPIKFVYEINEDWLEYDESGYLLQSLHIQWLSVVKNRYESKDLPLNNNENNTIVFNGAFIDYREMEFELFENNVDIKFYGINYANETDEIEEETYEDIDDEECDHYTKYNHKIAKCLNGYELLELSNLGCAKINQIKKIFEQTWYPQLLFLYPIKIQQSIKYIMQYFENKNLPMEVIDIVLNYFLC
eukprot:498816_1